MFTTDGEALAEDVDVGLLVGGQRAARRHGARCGVGAAVDEVRDGQQGDGAAQQRRQAQADKRERGCDFMSAEHGAGPPVA